LSEQVRTRIGTGSAAPVIHFGGYVDDQKTALQEIDVLIVPSTLDGRPNVVMEANACGVPVIGAPVGGIPELIEPGRNGVVLAPDQTERIAEVLAGWSTNPSSFQEICATCRATAIARFDRRKMIDAYEAVFREYLFPRQT
jgi:glycosyltransferase involved in cell wall biosynthesis